MRQLFSKPRLRSITSQLCAALPFYCLKFGNGASAGFVIILIAELDKRNSEIPITLDQLSWFASLQFLSPFGSIITGWLMHRLGNRVATFITSLLLIVSWLLFYYSTNATIILISGAINATTAAFVLCSLYISEITEPQLRGPFLAFSHLIVSFGSFFSLLLGSLMYWRHVALVNLLFPISTSLLVLIIPDSPTWLANKGSFDEAEKALCWLRGWVSANQVQAEFRDLVDSTNKSNELQGESIGWRPRSRRFFRQFVQRSFYLPLGTICLIFVLHYSSGGVVVQTYSSVIFRQQSSPIDQPIATAIMGAMRVFGSLTALFLVRRVGRRKLAFFSLVVAASCFLVVAFVGFFELQGQYLWIPPMALFVVVFAFTSGTGTIVYMLNSEIFPSSVRYVGSAIGWSVSSTMSSTVAKLFLYVVQAITLNGIFLLFAIVNVVSLVAYYLLIPETEGRSLKEIEDHYKGVKRLNERDER